MLCSNNTSMTMVTHVVFFLLVHSSDTNSIGVLSVTESKSWLSTVALIAKKQHHFFEFPPKATK
jgi:hypothetical protein